MAVVINEFEMAPEREPVAGEHGAVPQSASSQTGKVPEEQVEQILRQCYARACRVWAH